MNILPEFKENISSTIGVELELQLIDLQSFNLAMEAKDFLRRLSKKSHPGEIKPEITLAMIELNSSIHNNYGSLLAELHCMKDIIADEAAKTHIGICGEEPTPSKNGKNNVYFHQNVSPIYLKNMVF